MVQHISGSIGYDDPSMMLQILECSAVCSGYHSHLRPPCFFRIG